MEHDNDSRTPKLSRPPTLTMQLCTPMATALAQLTMLNVVPTRTGHARD